MARGVQKIRMVLETNVVVSAIFYPGKPRWVLELVLHGFVEGVTSKILLAELAEVLKKKFSFSSSEVQIVEDELKDIFEIVYPSISFRVSKDEPDNRVLEAAYEGNCNYVVTGDKELLALGVFRKIQIVNPDVFLGNFRKS